LAAAQGIDFRRRITEKPSAKLGKGTAVAYELIRQVVPFLEGDQVLAPHMEAVRKLVAAGTIKNKVEVVSGRE